MVEGAEAGRATSVVEPRRWVAPILAGLFVAAIDAAWFVPLAKVVLSEKESVTQIFGYFAYPREVFHAVWLGQLVDWLRPPRSETYAAVGWAFWSLFFWKRSAESEKQRRPRNRGGGAVCGADLCVGGLHDRQSRWPKLGRLRDPVHEIFQNDLPYRDLFRRRRSWQWRRSRRTLKTVPQNYCNGFG